MVKKKQDEDIVETPSTPDAADDSTLTQAQRDMPFQKRLSEILQAETDARDGQIARSQERQSETRRQQDEIRKEGTP